MTPLFTFEGVPWTEFCTQLPFFWPRPASWWPSIEYIVVPTRNLMYVNSWQLLCRVCRTFGLCLIKFTPWKHAFLWLLSEQLPWGSIWLCKDCCIGYWLKYSQPDWSLSFIDPKIIPAQVKIIALLNRHSAYQKDWWINFNSSHLVLYIQPTRENVNYFLNVGLNKEHHLDIRED